MHIKEMISLSQIITKKEKLVETYSGLIYPVCHPDKWDVPEFIRSVVVNPSIIRKQVGQPKTTRIPSIGERKRHRQQVCSNYRQVGHNLVKCTNIIPLTRASTSTMGPSIEPRSR